MDRLDPAAVIHVTPDGDDRATGLAPEPREEHGPLASLEAARDRARRAVAEANGPVEVRLGGGLYRRAEPFSLGPEDAGGPGKPVVWRARTGETPVITGAHLLTGWRRVSDASEAPAGTPAEAIGSLWMIDLPPHPLGGEKPWRFRALFDAEGALPRAAVRDLGADDEREGEATATAMPFRPDQWPALARIDGAEIGLCPQHNFAYNVLPIHSIDPERGWLHTSVSCTYRLRPSQRGVSASVAETVTLENVAEGLTEPGRWFLDAARNRLYLWPRADAGNGPEGVAAPSGCELMRVDGDPAQRRWGAHLAIEGIVFRHGDRMGMREDRVALQHDWEWEDEPNALLRLRGAEHVLVRGCVFEDAEAAGLRLDRHAEANRIERNTLRRLGGTGIALVGHGPGDRDEHRANVVAHNRIEMIGRAYLASSGIFLAQSADNAIRDNLVRELPYIGITLSGIRTPVFDAEQAEAQRFEGARTIDRDALADVPLEWPYHLGFLHSRFNAVEHNEIERAMLALGDGNGLYLSGTGVGNDVRRNHIHDLPGHGTQSALRTDGWEWYTRLRENVICRINAGGITVKQINEYDNNVVVDCRRHGCILARRSPGSPAHGTAVRRNILYQPSMEIGQPGPYPPFYEERGHAEGRPARLADLVIDDNVVWCPADPAGARSRLESIRADLGKEQRGAAGDPGFVDAAAGDFRLRADAPARALGIRSIESWGPRGPVGAPGA